MEIEKNQKEIEKNHVAKKTQKTLKPPSNLQLLTSAFQHVIPAQSGTLLSFSRMREPACHSREGGNQLTPSCHPERSRRAQFLIFN